MGIQGDCVIVLGCGERRRTVGYLSEDLLSARPNYAQARALTAPRSWAIPYLQKGVHDEADADDEAGADKASPVVQKNF